MNFLARESHLVTNLLTNHFLRHENMVEGIPQQAPQPVVIAQMCIAGPNRRSGEGIFPVERDSLMRPPHNPQGY